MKKKLLPTMTLRPWSVALKASMFISRWQTNNPCNINWLLNSHNHGLAFQLLFSQFSIFYLLFRGFDLKLSWAFKKYICHLVFTFSSNYLFFLPTGVWFDSDDYVVKTLLMKSRHSWWKIISSNYLVDKKKSSHNKDPHKPKLFVFLLEQN